MITPGGSGTIIDAENGRRVLVSDYGLTISGTGEKAVPVPLTGHERRRMNLALSGLEPEPEAVGFGRPWIVSSGGDHWIAVKQAPVHDGDPEWWSMISLMNLSKSQSPVKDVELLVPLVRPVVDAPVADSSHALPGQIWLVRISPALGGGEAVAVKASTISNGIYPWMVLDPTSGQSGEHREEDIKVITELFPAW